MAKRGPEPRADERIFIPRDRSEAVALEEALVECGTSRTMAGSIVMALSRLAEREHDGLLSPQRAVYRAELARLGQPPWEEPDPPPERPPDKGTNGHHPREAGPRTSRRPTRRPPTGRPSTRLGPARLVAARLL